MRHTVTCISRLILRCLAPALLGLVSAVSAQAPATWKLTRDVRIDAAEADLVPIDFLALSANGTIAVGQGKDGNIRFFGADGKELGRFGRSGSGPGEFERAPNLAGWFGTQLWVLDSKGRRATIIGSDRKTFRTMAFPAQLQAPAGPAQPPAFGMPTPLFMPSENELVLGIVGQGPPQPPYWAKVIGKGEILLARSNAQGQVQKVLVSQQDAVLGCMKTVAGTERPLDLTALCALPALSGSADGQRLLTLETLNFDHTRPSSFRVTAIALNGDTIFSRTYAGPGAPVPSKVSDSIRAAKIERYRSQPALLSAWKAVDLPTQYPAATRLVSGRDGTIWVALRAGAQQEYLVLSDKGAPIGRASLPRNVQIEAADGAIVWAIEKDEDDLPSLVRYRINR